MESMTVKEIWNYGTTRRTTEEIFEHPSFAAVQDETNRFIGEWAQVYFHCSDCPTGLLAVNSVLIINIPDHIKLTEHGPAIGNAPSNVKSKKFFSDLRKAYNESQIN